jgi:hypothetical protein
LGKVGAELAKAPREVREWVRKGGKFAKRMEELGKEEAKK